MSALTTIAPPLDWEFLLNFDHIIMLNEISTTYNNRLCQKQNTVVKLLTGVKKMTNYAFDLIEKQYYSCALGQVIDPTPIISESIFIAKTKALATKASATIP